jgi:hypothetical protein
MSVQNTLGNTPERACAQTGYPKQQRLAASKQALLTDRHGILLRVQSVEPQKGDSPAHALQQR